MTIAFRYLNFQLLLLTGWIFVSMAQADPAPTLQANPENTSSLPDPVEYDQLDAILSRNLAPLPAVVIAEVNIALHRARKRAADKLCGGRWMPRGNKVREFGPLLTEPPSDGSTDDQVWIYRTLHHPDDIDCGNVTRSDFFQQVSRYLPAWITIRPAAQATAYRQGIAVAAVKYSIMTAGQAVW